MMIIKLRGKRCFYENELFAREHWSSNPVYFLRSMIKAVEKESSRFGKSQILFASSVGLVWKYGLNVFVQRNPDDLRIVDPETGLYPLMLLASSHHGRADLDTIYEVMRTCPNVVWCR